MSITLQTYLQNTYLLFQTQNMMSYARLSIVYKGVPLRIIFNPFQWHRLLPPNNDYPT